MLDGVGELFAPTDLIFEECVESQLREMGTIDCLDNLVHDLSPLVVHRLVLNVGPQRVEMIDHEAHGVELQGPLDHLGLPLVFEPVLDEGNTGPFHELAVVEDICTLGQLSKFTVPLDVEAQALEEAWGQLKPSHAVDSLGRRPKQPPLVCDVPQDHEIPLDHDAGELGVGQRLVLLELSIHLDELPEGVNSPLTQLGAVELPRVPKLLASVPLGHHRLRKALEVHLKVPLTFVFHECLKPPLQLC